MSKVRSTFNNRPQSPCPCGSSSSYGACCGRYHAGEIAPTPEALMRSRYTAYVLGLSDYLLATWHLSTRPDDVDPGESPPTWLGLKIRARALQDENHGTVEFEARWRAAGRVERMHETSRFVREDGRWFYVDGDFS